jgi:hypothetical protein
MQSTALTPTDGPGATDFTPRVTDNDRIRVQQTIVQILVSCQNVLHVSEHNQNRARFSASLQSADTLMHRPVPHPLAKAPITDLVDGAMLLQLTASSGPAANNYPLIQTTLTGKLTYSNDTCQI